MFVSNLFNSAILYLLQYSTRWNVKFIIQGLLREVIYILSLKEELLRRKYRLYMFLFESNITA